MVARRLLTVYTIQKNELRYQITVVSPFEIIAGTRYPDEMRGVFKFLQIFHGSAVKKYVLRSH